MHESTLTRRAILQGTAGAVALATAGTALRPRRAAARQDVTLRWWDYYDSGANAEAMESQLQRYMDANPGITIERTALPFADLKQQLLQGAAAGQLPDIVVIDNPDHQAFAALGVLEDITERVAAWGQADAYFEGPWASTLWDGKNYGIPDNSNCLVQFVNSDVLAAAEVAPPVNWEDLTAAVATLTEGDRFGLAVSAVKSEEGTFQWLPFLWETGEDIPTIDSEGGQRALQLWVDMVNAGYMSKGILGWTQQDVLTQFQNGKAAIMVNGPWQVPVLKEQNPDLNWDVATLPVDKQGASILGGENMAIVAGGPNVDAAWELVAWTQETENLKRYLAEAGKLPSRADLAEDPYWTEDPVFSVFVEQLKVAKPRAYGSKYPEISNAIQEAIQGAVSGQVTAADALARAQATITPLLP